MIRLLPDHFPFRDDTGRYWLWIPPANRFIILRMMLLFGGYVLVTKGLSWNALLSSVFLSLPAGYLVALAETHAWHIRKTLFRRRRLSAFIARKLVRLAFLLSVIFSLVALLFIQTKWMPNTLFPGTLPAFYQGPFWVLVGIALLEDMLTSFGLELRSKLGKGVLWNLLIGTYHRPMRQHRLFLFIDLKDSTTLAEQMGELKYSELLQDFFYDLAGPIERYRGEVYQYVGDEIVVSWPVEEGSRSKAWMHTVLLAQAYLAAKAPYYRHCYGQVPAFWAGIHLGAVTVAEVGKYKSEIAYHGDVVNTTARITGLCKELNRPLLFSDEVCRRLPADYDFAIRELGFYRLKGKSQAIKVWELIENENFRLSTVPETTQPQGHKEK